MDFFTASARISETLRARCGALFSDWGLIPGPPVHPEVYRASGGTGDALGGIRFLAQGPRYRGPVVVFLMADGLYTVYADLFRQEGVRENELGLVLDRLIRKGREDFP